MDEIHETAPTLEDLERRVAELETELADAKRRAAGSVDRLKSDTVDPDLSQSSIGSSEVRFRQLVETSGAGIVVHKGWTPLYANQAYSELFGYGKPEEIIAAGTIEHLFTPRALELMASYRQARLAGEYAPSEYEVEGVHRNGERIWVRNTVRVMEVDGEQLIHCTAIDTTERNLAEQALRESGYRFRTLFENAPISIREVNHSKVKDRIDSLGITDHDGFVTYLDQHPDFIDECVQLAEIVRVNQACLDLHGAADQTVVVKQLQANFSDHARGIFAKLMITIFDC